MNLYPPPHSTLQLLPAWSLRVLPAALLPALLLILTLGAAPQAQAQTIVNICDRTTAVQDSILASVQVRTNNCAEVTDSMLAGITHLNLSYRGITALQAGDFAGLTAMTSLSLNGNSLTTLPAGIFSDLTALNVLDLSRNLLTKDLQPTVFSGLTALRTLNLNNNRMSELPAGLFNGLTALRTLNLQNGIGEIRSIRSLPAGIFDQLTALSSLDLSFNRLTTFPPGIFSNLAALNSLKLNKNSLARVPDTAFSGFQGQLNTMHTASQDPGGSFFYGAIKIYVYLNQIGNTVTVTVPAGAFKELKVDLIISSDDAMSTTPTTATITLPVGELTGTLVLSPSGGETLTARFADTNNFVRHPGLGGTQLGGIRALRFVRGTNVAGFCDRTAAVRDALLALDQVSNNCYTVTPGQLVGVTTLDLSSQSISALKAGDFAGLTAMTQLNLSGNSLATLPAGVFSGLPALVNLDLGGNEFTDLPNDTFTGLTTALTTLSAGNQTSANANANLSLYLSQIGNTVTATLPSAAFAATTAHLTVSSDDTNVADITQTISIPVGQTSGTTTLVPTSSDTLTAAFDATTPLTFAGITPTGLSIATPNLELVAGFCSRTTEVQAAIITAIGGSPAQTCDTVTSTHLAGISDELDLSNLGITTLRTGDFAGLTTVTGIDLSDNSGLTALPSNLFANLGTVTTLNLSGSGLAALSADTFSGLTALQTLNLSDNSITSLLEGAGAFSNLATLQTLHLNKNAIQIVPAGAFNGLTALRTLNLDDNDITSLDADALNPLTALRTLDLSTNRIFHPPASSFSGLADLRILDLSDNIIYRLDANTFSSLDKLTTLHLYNNGISQLFATTFSGLIKLTTLDLSNNIIYTLPAGIFNPLVALSSLDLSRNNLPVLPNDTFTGFQPSTQRLTSLSLGNQTDAGNAMRVYLFLTQDGNTVTATLPAGAPADLTLNLSVISSGGGAPTTATISIAAGATSGTHMVSSTQTADFAATPLSHTALTLTGADIRAAADPVPGFCNRTPGVRDGVLAVVSTDDCTLVTYPMLAGISGELDLSVASSAAPTIISLKSGDFEGLTAVSALSLQNQALSTMPAGIFNDLGPLTALDLSGNNIVTLPDDIFTTGFPSTLTELSLGDQTSSDNNMNIRVYLSQAGTTVTATLPSGAFTATDVNLSLTDSGGSSPTTPAISLAAGKTSNTLTVSGTQTAAFASANPLTYTGAITVTGADIVSIVQVAGFCNRTAQVQATILAASATAAANNNCAEVTPDMLAAITTLNLGRRGITSLQAGDFDGLTALQTLKLNDNSITSLPENLFDGLTSLQNLFLAGNRGITALPAGLLAGLTSLQNFYLNHTGVTTLPEELFDGLSSLQDIYLNHSSITSLPEGLFDGLSRLEILHIHTNSLPSLPAGIFAGLSSLTDLQLYSNQLTALPANLFNGPSSLQNLYLDRNSIASLPAAVFAGLSSLQNLYLNSNQLTSLPAGLFAGLSSLADLRLGSNQLTTLPAGIFNGLSSLANLRLDSNQLTTLPAGIFNALTALTALNLANNDITTLPAGIFNALTALTALNLANNDIATLPNGTFTDFSATLGTLRLQAQTDADVAMKVPLYLHQIGNLVIASIRAGAPAALTVNLSVTSSGGGAATATTILIPVGGTSNSITLVPTGGETLTADFAATTPATLDIATLQGVTYETRKLVGGICDRTPTVRNKLLALTAATFCDQVDATALAGVTTLDLSNAGIESLQAGDFADLTELTTLNLSGNSLAALPSGIFTALAKVTTLNLSGNSLTALPTGVFTALAKVTTLNLSGNLLTAPGLDTGDPAAGIFKPLQAMTGLDLSDNRITALPAGIFSFGTGKSALTDLDLSSQNGLVGNLRMSLQPSWDSGTATLDVPAGVPAALTVQLAVTDSGTASGTLTLTVPLGATSVSGSQTGTAVTLGPGSTSPSWANGTTVTGLDFTFGICNRTMQVQATLLARVRMLDGVDNNIGCGGVTDTMLATLGTANSSNPGGGGSNILDLRGNSQTKITSLQANDFAGLSGFTFLYLQGNELTELPVGVFNGLTAVVSVSLQKNKIATIPPGVFNSMPLSSGVDLSSNELAALPKDLFTGRTAGIGGLALGDQFDDTNDNRVTQPTMDIPVFLLQGGNRLTLTVPTGAPNALTVNLTITSSPANTTSTQTITIPVGRTTATANLTPAAGQTLSAAFASSSPFSHSSLTLLGAQFVGQIGGICSRSPAVQTALIATPQVTATSCEDVSDDMLSAITGTLDLSGGISALRAGDFAGLTGLTGLNLSDNGLTALPAGIFDVLVALTTLDLSGNHLAAPTLDTGDPAASIFAPLQALTTLDLRDNRITFLPAGTFNFGTGKSALTNLDLRSQNGLSGNLQLNLMPTWDSGTNMITVVVPAGVPAHLMVPLSVTADGTTSTKTVTVLSGTTSASTSQTGTTVALAGGATPPSWASGTNILGLDFTFGICGRTAEVQTLLLTKVSATTCGAVTDAMLNGISSPLILSGTASRSITSLKPNDFAGLSGITQLELSNNSLTDLPEGVFNGLTATHSLYLHNNKIATIAPGVFNPIKLTSVLNLSGNALATLPKDLFTGRTEGMSALRLSNQFDDADDGIATQPNVDIPVLLLQDGNHLTLTVPTGTPNALTVSLTITSSPANTTSTQSITIPVGQTTGTATLTPATGQTLSAAFASASTFSHPDLTTLNGAQFVGRIVGICSRSPAVQTAIIAKVPATTCNTVSDEMLNAATGTLDLSSASLSALQAGDLDMLTGLQGLNLADNSLTALTAGIFDDLGALTTLDLSGNHLAAGALLAGTPAASIFAPLTALVDLNLRDNRLESLPDGIFTGLTLALTKLDLSSQNDSTGTALGGNLKMLVKPSWASGTITVAVPTGVPAPLTVAFDAVGGAASSAAVTVPLSTTAGTAATGTTPLAVSAPGTAVWLSLSAAPSFSSATVTGLDFETGICARNAAVQAKLVAAITPATNCAEIDATALATITTALDLSNLGIAALDANDLAGLTEVTSLDLTGNALTTLPAGVFDSLAKVTTLTLTDNKLSDSAPSVFENMAALTTLKIDGNEFRILPDDFFKDLSNELALAAGMQFNDNPDSGGSDIAEANAIMPLSLVQNSANELTVDFPAAAFANLTVNLDLTAAAEGSTGTVEVLAGTNSNATPLTLTASGSDMPTAAINTTTPATVGADNMPVVAGVTYQIAEPGICSRSIEVQTALIALVTPTICATVSDSILNEITGTLDLSSAGLGTLQGGDLDDLTKLQVLKLQGNSLTSLTAGIFDDLVAVTELDLGANALVVAGVPAGIFSKMAALADLDLSGNELASLPNGIFSFDTGKSALTMLDVSNQFANDGIASNELATLPLLVKPSLSGGTVTVSVPAGVPAPLTVALGAVGATAPATTTATLATGTTTATGAPVLTASGSKNIEVALSATPAFAGSPSPSISGLTIATGICDRTPQVQTALVAAISGAGNCADVTATQLVALNSSLDLSADATALASSPAITALKPGDFAGLTELTGLDLEAQSLRALAAGTFAALGKVRSLNLKDNQLDEGNVPANIFDPLDLMTSLDLSGNEFESLPAGIFGGLATDLASFDVRGQFRNDGNNNNDIASFSVLLTLGLSGNTATVTIPTGAPEELVVSLDLTGHNTMTSPASVTIPVGATSGTAALIPATPGGTVTATLNSTPPTLTATDTGLVLLTIPPGICGRGAQVQAAILATLGGGTTCADVTDPTTVTGTLDLSKDAAALSGLPAIAALSVSDLAGLSAITALDLAGQSLTAITPGLFADLGEVTTLDLSGNDLPRLLAGDFTGLAKVTTLNLSDNQLLATGVPANIFKPLLAMTSLDLSGNELSRLPNGIFADLTAALNTKLDVSGQFSNDNNTADIDNFDVPLDLSVDGSNVATVTIPTGAPQALTVNLDLTGHDITSSPPSPTSVTIAIGATSGTATLIPATSGGTVTAALNATLPTLTATTGITLIAGSSGICDRNEVVEAALLAKIGGGATCGSVTPSILGSLSGTLDLSLASGVTSTITALAASDFADLTRIDTVDLGNQGLTTIAANLFGEMTALTTLDLSGNAIATLATSGFSTLTKLTTLDLSGNDLAALPATPFTGLSELTSLDLSANQIASLGADALTGLARLSILNLGGNALTALPANLLSGSTALTALDFSENKLANLPASLLDGLTIINTLKFNGNLLTSLPDGFFEGIMTTLTALSLENQGNDAGETLLAAIPLTLRPQVTGTTASVRLATGAPTDLTLTLSVTDGGSTSNSTPITILAGATTSSTFTVPNVSATVSPNAPTNVPATFTGLAWLTSGSTSGAAGICDRTDQVQTALLALVNGDTQAGASGYKYCGDIVAGDLTALTGELDLNAAGITQLSDGDFADLSGITGLDLSSNAIAALADSGFSALTELTSLDLSANQLTSLGAATFTGLTKLTTLNLRANQLREARIDATTLAPLDALTGLDLHGNELTGLPASLFSGVANLTSLDLRDQFSNDDQIPDLPTVTLSLVPLVQDTTVQVQAPSGAPTELTVTLAVTEGTLSPTTLTIAAGTLNSGNSTLTPDAGAVSNTISITDDPTYDSSNFLGIRWETGATANPSGGICARTPQVQIALLALVNGATTSSDPGYQACQDIDETDLAALTGTLDLSLTTLTSALGPSDAIIDKLRPGDFADLTGITTLTLTGHTGNTGLTGLPTNILVGLSALTTLDLSGNALTALPANPFNGLTATTLTSLDLSGNALTALPPLSFGGLTALTSLDLGDNAIASLASGTLAPFAATLTTLHLQDNELTALPDGFFRGATALTTLSAGLQTSTDADISLALEPVFDGGELRLLMPAGAPVELTLNVATTSGTLTPTSLTIAAGATLSGGASTLSYSGAAPTVSISADPTVAATITGLAWDRTATAVPTDGICGRTAQVGDALLALINGDTVLGDAGYVACQDATASLASLTGTLDLSSASITALKAGDFAGLPALTGLDLSGNTLTELPASPFSALAALTSLDLSGNALTSTAVVPATLTGLAALTSLDLSGNALTTLAADLLSVPTALASLDLSGNRIASLPDGFFAGIASLTSLDLSSQDHDSDSGASTPVQGVTLTIRPILSGDKISLLLPTGAPTGLTVPLATTGGTATPSTLTFAAGNTLSNQATFIAVGSSSLSIGVAQAPTYSAIAFAGLLWNTSATLDPSAGICSRTGAVKDALVALVNGATTAGAPGYKYCQDIVAGDLTALTGELDLNAAGVSQLSNGDFADLSGITEVDLGGNSLVRLDANTFTGLSALTSLDLSNNSLTYLVADSLTGLPTTLTTLTMSGNTTLTRLPSGLFSTLTGLTSLDLSGNALASLPISPFTALASLDTLSLQNNNLTRVTVSVFSGLAALTTLNMQGNDMDQFPGGVLAPLSALATLNLRGNDLTELPDGFFAGLTNLASLDLSDQVSANTNLAIALTPIYLSASGTAQVRIATGAPVALSVVLTPYAGGTALATQTLSIPAGATLSGPSTALPPTAAELGIATPTGAEISVSGVTWTVPDADSRLNLSSGICGRQSAVLTALLAALNTDKSAGDSGYLYCQDVAGTDLASLTSLSLSGQTLTGLTADDFTGLDSLTSLTLTGDTSLTSLPSGLFAGLGALTTLDLSGNALTTLAAADFADLAGLTRLDLSRNKLATLPDGFFTGMPALTALDLSQDPDNDPSTAAQDITLELTPLAADLQISVQLLTGAPTALDIILTTEHGTLTPIDPAPAQSASQSASQSAGQPSAQSAIPTLPNAVPTLPNAVPTLPNAVPAAGQTATVRIAAGSTTSSAVLFTSGTNPLPHQVSISAKPRPPAGFTGLDWNIATVATPREGICSRTAQIRDVLLAAVNGDTMPGTTGYKSCDDIVASEDLQAITSNLDLRPDAPALASSPPITSLKPGDFANLTAVTGLNLSGNQITDLPSILFSGLDALTSLDLSDNWLGSMTPTELFGADGDGGLFGVLDLANITLDVSGNPGTLSLARVTIKRTGFDKLQITRSPMLPVEWEVPLTIDGGQLPQPSVTIAAGDAMSPEFDIVPESPYTSGTFVGIDTSGNPAPDGFYGFDINYRKLNVEVGICKRTPQVQKAILEQVVLASTCRDVTAQLLAAYDGPLDMSGKSVTALRVGDFVGLHRMRHLHLQDNQLTSLSADILAPMIGMHVLSLARNHLTTLPADAFDALAKLTTLDLRGNRLDSLPDATFGTAPRLTHLYLQDNQLAELPAGIFGTDPRLTHLYLHNNQIAALPAGIFGAAPGLTHLYLHNNQLATLPDATFSGFTPGLTELSLQDNPGAPFALTTNLVVDEDAKTVQVQVPLAAPEALAIPFTLTGGASDQNVEASLAAGTSSSAPQTVAFAADNAPVTASLDSLPTLSDGITGIELVAGDDTVVIRNGICGHTPEVRDAILADANVTSDCGSVSATELALVRTLALNRKDIAELTVYDFIGLDGLTTLDLSENDLTELPAGVFDRPAGVFAGLAALTTLNLSGNALTELPAGIFADLTSLATLNLHDNAVDPFKFAVDLATAETAAGFDISATVADSLPTPAGSLTVHARVHADRTTSDVQSFTPPAALSVAATVNLVAVSALCFGETPTDSDGTGCEGKNPSFTGVQLTAGAAAVVDPHPTFDGVTVADLTVLQRTETSLQLPAAIAMVPTGVPAPTFTYSLTASEGGTQLAGMPAGLAFDAATRTLSGRPAAAGVFSMDYGVRDDNGDDDSLSFTLTVTAQDNDTYRNLHAQILSRFAITVADNAGQAIADRVDRMVRGQKPRFSTNAEATAVEIPFKGAWSIWTQDERTQTTQSTAADWDWSGSVNSQHTGVDWQSPGSTLVLGMMAQDSEGSFSYTGRAGPIASLTGDYRTPLTGEHFYLGWSPRGQNSTSWFTFWMASGSGSGEMNLSGVGGPDLRSDIDLDTSHFSVAITPVNVMRGLRIKLRAEMSTADLSLAASEGVDPMSLEVTRERVLLEPSTPSLLDDGHQQLTLSAEIGTRTDSTSVSGFADGDITGLPQGEGDEYGLKLRYTWKHIDIEAGARSMQLDSDEGSYEEEGYFMTFSLGSCKNCSHNRGFAMSLSPTWGNTSSGAQRLWDESHLNRVGGAGTGTAKSLSTEFSYGLALPVGGRAVMVPYSRLQTGGDNQWSTVFGTRLQFGDNFEVNFERTGQIGGQSSTASELKLGATLNF